MKDRCPSLQVKPHVNGRIINPSATCVVCGKWVRVTKSGKPYPHKGKQ